MAASRDSNIELMRIVIMFFVVFLHFLTNAGFLSEGVGDSTFLTVNTIRGFLLVAVNCFVLISGYFGIHFKIRTLLNLYLLVAFYGILAYCLHLAIDGAQFGKSFIYSSVLCVSSTKLWFIPCYMALYLLSPLLNKARDGMDRNEYIYALAALTVLNVYFGYLWGNEYFNLDGFTIAQMVYLYFIGGFIRRFVSISWVESRRWILLSVYVAATLVWSALAFINHTSGLWHWHTNYYNNPCILISSTAFFLFFISFKFYNRTVNYLASGVFAVYVVQDGKFFRDWFKQLCQDIAGLPFLNGSLGCQILAMAFLAAVTVLVIVNFDKLRMLLFKPLNNLIPNNG